MLFEIALCRASVVVDEEEAQGLDVRKQFLGEGEGSAHQTRHTLAQSQIEPFHVVGLSLLFSA